MRAFPHRHIGVVTTTEHARLPPPAQLGARVAGAARACTPSSLWPLMQAVGTEGAAVTALTAMTIVLLVPFTVSLVDEFYLLKASAKAKRALRAARSRDLARQR